MRARSRGRQLAAIRACACVVTHRRQQARRRCGCPRVPDIYAEAGREEPICSSCADAAGTWPDTRIAVQGDDGDLSLFCIFGWFALAICRPHTAPVGTLLQNACHADGGQFSSAAAATTLRCWPRAFLGIACCIAGTAAARQSATVLWPLFVRDRFGWDASAFSGALLVESFGSIGSLFLLPSLAARVGEVRLAALLCMLSAVLAAFALYLNDALTHVGCMAAMLSFLAMLDSALRSLGSLCVPAALQGRAFAYLGVLTSLGNVAGNLSTRLYDTTTTVHATDGAHASPLLPASAVLACSAAIVIGLLPQLEKNQKVAGLSPPASPQSTGLEDEALLETERAILLHKAAARPPFDE